MNPTFESRPSTTMHSLASSHRIHVDNWTPLQLNVEMDYIINQVEPVDIPSVENQLSRACQNQLQELIGNKNHIPIHETPINEETTHLSLYFGPELRTGIQAACETSVNILNIVVSIPCRCLAYPSTFDLRGDFETLTRVDVKVCVALQDRIDDSNPTDLTARADLVDGIPEAYQEKIDEYLQSMSRASWFKDSDKKDVKEGVLYDEPVLEIESIPNATLLKYRVTAADRDGLLEVLGRAFWGDLLIGCCLMSLFMFFWGGLISVVIYGIRIKKLETVFRAPTNASDAFDAYKSYAAQRNDDYMTYATAAPAGSILVFFAAGLFTSQFFVTHPLLLIIVSVVFLFITGPASFIFPAMVMAG